MKTSANRLSKEQIDQIAVLAQQGFTDREIARQFGNVTDGAIFNWRKKLGISTTFTYEKVSKMDHKEMERLFNLGLSDYKIAKLMNVKPCSVFSYRKAHNIGQDRNLKYNKAIKPTKFQYELLIGTLLGDASLAKSNTNPRITCAHGIKQKEYCEYKATLLKSLGASTSYHKRSTIDSRTGIFYEDYTMRLPANPEFLPLFNAFYPNGIKVLPIELLNEYSAVSLAFHFMDDGYKMKNGYALATNCFSQESLQVFVKFLFDRFQLQATVWKSSNTIYIHKCSKEKFKNLIEPYVCDCMKYKL